MPPAATIPPTPVGAVPFTTDLYTRLEIPSTAEGIRDAALVDLNGDGNDELYLLAKSISELTQIDISSANSFEITIQPIRVNPLSFLLAYQEEGNPILIAGSRQFSEIHLMDIKSEQALTQTESVVLDDPPEEAFTADYNDDGRMDVILAGESRNALFVMEALENGIFRSPRRTSLANNTIQAAVLEHRGTIRHQLISSTENSNLIALQTILENGSLFPQSTIAIPQSFNRLISGFLNDDTLADFIAYNQITGEASLFLAESPARYAREPLTPIANGITEIQTRDMNRDGVDELITVSGSRDAIAFRLHNQDSPVSFPAPVMAHLLHTGDINGDGIQDFLAISEVDNTIWVYISKSPTTIQDWVKY